MTIINIHMKDEDKKKIQKFIKSNTNKSMSDFIREVIKDGLNIEEKVSEIESEEYAQEIPEYIPKKKYAVFVKGAIIAVGDNPSDLACIALEKFPRLPFTINFNGPKKDAMEYI
ncbi:MAG: hypothetical protein ACTSR3_23605 [Candidatus Helarchaeota archaeon]